MPSFVHMILAFSRNFLNSQIPLSSLGTRGCESRIDIPIKGAIASRSGVVIMRRRIGAGEGIRHIRARGMLSRARDPRV